MATTFNVPAAVVVGEGALAELPAQVRRLGAQRVLLVTDRFFATNGLAARVVGLLTEAGIASDVFDEVQPDPTDVTVRAGVARYRAVGADLLVALGGGSPIDAAKAIAMLATNAEPLSQYMGYHKVARPGAPLIAIPTTAGTGSEVTKVSVITDTGRDVKMMMLDVHLLPTVAIVDYELSMSMPRDLTAHVGVDTLTHGIEAYVSRKATPMTDPLALSCIRLVATHLPTACAEPGNREARAGMSLAAVHGGMAFANSSVCLVHGMSRPIGALFHVPHGLSNAVLLPAVTRFSLPGAPTRYAAIARAMGFATDGHSDASAGAGLVAGLVSLNETLGVPRLGACRGMDRARFDALVQKMAQDALASGSPANNPVVPTAEEIVRLYHEAW
jgi:alcohol dehydrogenase class IV